MGERVPTRPGIEAGPSHADRAVCLSTSWEQGLPQPPLLGSQPKEPNTPMAGVSFYLLITTELQFPAAFWMMKHEQKGNLVCLILNPCLLSP